MEENRGVEDVLGVVAKKFTLDSEEVTANLVQHNALLTSTGIIMSIERPSDHTRIPFARG